MDAFAGAVFALMLFLFGIVTGVGVGERLAPRCVTRRDYWVHNIVVLLVGAASVVVVNLTPFPVLMALAVGLVAGTVAGLKLNFGESVGPWHRVDDYFHVNKKQIERAEDPERAEAERRERAAACARKKGKRH